MSDPDRFRFSPHDEEPDAPLPDEALIQRVDKIGRRLSFVTLLLPCLLAIVIYVVYRDLATILTQSRAGEQQSVEALTTRFEQQLAGLAARLDALEAGLKERLEALPKNVSAVQEELRKSDAALAALRAEKADKKELADSLARTDAAVAAVAKDLQALAPFREELGAAAALRQELTAVAARLAKLEAALGKDLTGMAGFIEKSRTDLTQLRAEMTRLAGRTIDRETLDLELLKSRRITQIALEQEAARLDKSLAGLQRRLDQLERAAAPSPARGGAAPGTIREQTLE
jgi:septal ring factor EnvC (AmiA/AmiB activator)